MAKNFVRENVPLSRFGVLVAQLESIVASAVHKSPDSLLCFDLLSDLVSAINEEPKESILLWQRKCEDALYSLLVLGARRPVRHLTSMAMSMIIRKGDGISIYSRASSLQGFLSDGKKNDASRVAGAAQCLGELYHHFGRRITSGLLETTNIVGKLMKFNEDFVREAALQLLQNALEGSCGNAPAPAYAEAFRIITRLGVGDKSFIVRIAAARCLKAFANIGGPGLGVGELDSSASYCVKAFEDPVSSVRDAYAEALGAILAIGMNPDAQVQPRGKSQFTPKKLDGCLQKHLVLPFTKASGPRWKDIRISLTLSWVSFLQAMRLKYHHPDIELQDFAQQVMDMLRVDGPIDAQALACVVYILRVGVIDQMMEPTQRSSLVYIAKQLKSPDTIPAMKVAVLCILSYSLKSLGEVPLEFKEVLDDTVIAALSHHLPLVRIEAALTLRSLAEVDPTCVGGLLSYATTTLNALRDNVSYGKGSNLVLELNSLHGQAAVLAALVAISPKLPLGYPARLPKSILEVCKKMLTESSRNPVAAATEKEAGWLLLASLLASMPKVELEDQVFDILSLWAFVFSESPDHQLKQTEDQIATISVWSAAVDALTTFIRCFVSPNALNRGILLQPVLFYLSRALSYVSLVLAKDQLKLKPAVDVYIIKTLIAYEALSDPTSYRAEHPQIIQICTTPFRDAAGCEESSCLRMLLDKRDAWLGPLVPGSDWLEDELRAFQGGKDGVLPCVWEDELPFPQPETIGKMLVNQMLLCFGIMFAAQDSGGMLSLLGMMEQCLKAGKRQVWRVASITNICAGLLAGLKASLALRPQPLGLEILNLAQSIFLGILAEGDICASQRRASSEGLGLLTRLGNDGFTARLTRLLLGDLAGATDSCYVGSIVFALGCIHRSAGGMALSSLVPVTVNSISSLAKSSITGLQLWSLHGLVLTIEAAGLSYISNVQATLGLALDILLSDENGQVDLQQGIGRLINAIVAVIGPELAPGSIFFSRCKSVVAEISSHQQTSKLLESIRFTQQLVLFAPQAVTVHSHVQALLPTLSSRQPTLRHIAVSTLRHLIEKDPDSIIGEQIEDLLFHMLDEETDSEIGNLVRSIIIRLLYASCPSRPSHWLSLCRSVVLATSMGRDSTTNGNSEHDNLNSLDGEPTPSIEQDDESMVSHSKGQHMHGGPIDLSSIKSRRDKHLRYRTRIFAAECLSQLPAAVGNNLAHFDLSLARKYSGDWLVLQVQELISLAYQMSTIQLENMRPIGVGLLNTIVDKFEMTPDPELPGRFLIEQYQAQLISAVRTALDESSGPSLLEAGLQLATKILTSGLISGDQAAVRRIFSLISRPLSNFEDLYYPSFAEWVSCRIKVRLLTAHASLKCYTCTLSRNAYNGVQDDYRAQLSLFSESSKILGKYWISILRDYSYVCFGLHLKQKWKPFLEGIQSPLVFGKLQPCLEEAWPVMLQAVALDAIPVQCDKSAPFQTTDNLSENTYISGYSMVELTCDEFQFLWGFSLLLLFQGRDQALTKHLVPLGPAKAKLSGKLPVEDYPPTSHLYDIVLPVFQFLSSECFFSSENLSMDACRELLQIFTYSICLEDSWDSLAISILSQIVQNCPKHFLKTESFASLVTELCLGYLFKSFKRLGGSSSNNSNWDDIVSASFTTSKALLKRLEPELPLKSMMAFFTIGYQYAQGISTEQSLSQAIEFVRNISSLLKKHLSDKSNKLGEDDICCLRTMIGACLNAIASLTKDFIEQTHMLEKSNTLSSKLLQSRLAFFLEQSIVLSKISFELECPKETQENNPMLFAFFRLGTKCIQTALSNTNMQVQVIALQVLKSMVQRTTDTEDSSFTLFFYSELLRDIFNLIQRLLRPINRQAAAIVSECVRVLMLLQTLEKDQKFQKALMHILLEAVLMIFFASEDGISQEANDLRSMAMKLVSQLAQIPASAVHIKDVLLMMPVEHRQQLQDIIRASVMDDQNATQAKTVAPLVIKLPAITMETKPKGYSIPSVVENTDKNTIESEEEEEEDDDWDAFQSIPASAKANESDSNAKMISVDSDNDLQEHFGPLSSDNVTDSDAKKNAIDIQMVSVIGDSQNQKEELHGSDTNDINSKPDDQNADITINHIEEDDLPYLDSPKSQENITESSDNHQDVETNTQLNQSDDLIHTNSQSVEFSDQIGPDSSLSQSDDLVHTNRQNVELSDQIGPDSSENEKRESEEGSCEKENGLAVFHHLSADDTENLVHNQILEDKQPRELSLSLSEESGDGNNTDPDEGSDEESGITSSATNKTDKHPVELSLNLSDETGDVKNTDPEEGSDEESGNKSSATNETDKHPEELSLNLSDETGDVKNTDPDEGIEEESGNKSSATNETDKHPEELSLNLSDETGDVKNTDPDGGSDLESGIKSSATNKTDKHLEELSLNLSNETGDGKNTDPDEGTDEKSGNKSSPISN
ncbi:protein SWEETIE isoform X2 [Impatiens glandulifera]|uniref:protein SWEETIE isoform X2 n=1 Tax=Impatiens glandulifera TaxID=253017 RepID=UPI001FB14A76|nr:protein SWEETIE isoform X2 [Impatiens glandulifera]